MDAYVDIDIYSNYVASSVDESTLHCTTMHFLLNYC